MESITSQDGTTIAFERTGNGPPLVLVHGTSADHVRWMPVLPPLEERFTVYAIDRRGRGESGDAAAYSVPREAEDIAGVVASISEPVTLLGHSYGALCSLEAVLLIGALRQLILYEPALPVGEHYLYSEPVQVKMQDQLDRGEAEEVVVTFFREIVEFSAEQVDTLRAAPEWPRRVKAAHTILRETEAERDFIFDPDRYRHIETPTMLMQGSESAPFLVDATRAVAAALPNSTIVVLEGQGHIAQTTAPQLFVDTVLAFTATG